MRCLSDEEDRWESESDTTTLPVVFRADIDDGTVTAVFPTLPFDHHGRHYVVAYAHVGQHCAAGRAWYNGTRPATLDEYSPLLTELEGIYDDVELRVVKRWTRKHDKQRREALLTD